MFFFVDYDGAEIPDYDEADQCREGWTNAEVALLSAGYVICAGLGWTVVKCEYQNLLSLVIKGIIRVN